LSLIRLRQVHWASARDALFLVGLVVVFAFQFAQGFILIGHPRDAGDVETIADLVTCCCLIGIGRSWELIGGPSITFRQEIRALVQTHQRDAKPSDDTGREPPA
jgi:hypothetical protein